MRKTIGNTARRALLTLLSLCVITAGGTAVCNAATVRRESGSSTAITSQSFYFSETEMYTYSRLQSDIELLKRRYSGVSSDSIGSTEDGRQLYRIVIGNPNAQKRLLVVGAMHAREYITTPLLMRQLKDLLDRREGGDTSLESICVQFVPMLDPDGVAISQYALDGLNTADAKKKIQAIINSWADWGLLEDQNKYDWYLNKWKNNVNGVDLNRNFPTAGWEPLKDLRDKPASDLYKGPAAASERETQAIMKLVRQEHFSEVLNYHSQGQIIYWSNSHASEEVQARNQVMASIAGEVTGYPLVAGLGESTSALGCSFKDWLDVQMKIPNITLEVGLGTAPVPETQIETIWARNQRLLPELMKELLGERDAAAVQSGAAASGGAASEDSGTVSGNSEAVVLNRAPEAAQSGGNVQLAAPEAE